MTDTQFDRAPGDSSLFGWKQKPGLCPMWASTRSDWLFAVILTATSFWVANTSLLWAPGVPLGLVGARHRPDGRSSGLLPAHHHRAGQHQ